MIVKTIMMAGALTVAGVAHASLDDFTTGNSSVAFIAYDNVSTSADPATGSVFIDLGFNLNDFDPLIGNNLSGMNQKVVWNFHANTITANGVLVNASNDFSAFAPFMAADGADAKWAVIAGDSTSTPQRILTTGTPTNAQLVQENAAATAGALGVQSLFAHSGVSNAFDNGSYYAGAGDASYVAKTTNFSTNWQNKLKWAATTANTQNNFTMALGDGSEMAVGTFPYADTPELLNGKGTFTLDKVAGTLTWDTSAAPIPEPGNASLALIGLVALGYMARRKD
jgi:hypothetical protein